MITASQIRIGNWFIGYDNKPFKFGLYEFGLLENNHCELDEIIREPIPLTPEILEAAGFKKTLAIHHRQFNFKYYDYRLGTMVCNANEKWDDIEVEYCARGIEERAFIGRYKYFHQLQNLYFALTGQELTINLYATA